MPLPSLARLPLPLRPPENVVLALLPPTLRATAAGLALVSVKPLPEPCNPPKTAAVNVPKLSDPPPLVSNAPPASAPVSPRSSVPAETSVVPVKLFEADSVNMFGPALISPPGPVKLPARLILPPVVSIVAFPPLPVSVMATVEDQADAAPSVPPPKLKKAAPPAPLIRPEPAKTNSPPSRLYVPVGSEPTASCRMEPTEFVPTRLIECANSTGTKTTAANILACRGEVSAAAQAISALPANIAAYVEGGGNGVRSAGL